MTEDSLKSAGGALIWQATNMAGTKGIFFLRLVILARLLTPDDFGLMAIAVTAIGFLMSVTDFGMEPALVQSKEVDERLYNVAWTLRLSRALLVTIIVFLSATLIAETFAEPRAANIIRFVAFRPVLDALASMKLAGFTRKLHFRPLTILGLSKAIVNTVISIALARTFGVWALVAGTLAESGTHFLMSYLLAPYAPRFSIDRNATRLLVRFGRWVFLTSLVAMVGSYVLRAVITRQLGVAELGLFYLGAQLAFFPLEVASEVVGAVTFPLFARIQQNVEMIAHSFHTILIGIAALLFPICALLIALAPTLVQDVLGERWAGTVPVIRVLALVSMIGVFGDVTGPIFKGVGQPYKITAVEVVQTSMIIMFVWGFTNSYGLVGAALAWLPTIVVSQVVSAIFIRQILPRPFANLGIPFLVVLFASSVGAAVALGVDRLVAGLPGLISAILVATIIMGGVIWTAERRFALGLTRGLTDVFPQIAAVISYLSPKGQGRLTS